MDLWGPYKHDSYQKQSIFFLDDFSRTTWTYFVHSKTQVPVLMTDFLAYVDTQLDTSIKIIISENNVTKIFQESCTLLFAAKGTIHQRSLLGEPQQKRRVERNHKHLLKTARAIKFHVELTNKIWVECLLYAPYLINIMPSVVLQWKIPYECLMKQLPTYDY